MKTLFALLFTVLIISCGGNKSGDAENKSTNDSAISKTDDTMAVTADTVVIADGNNDDQDDKKTGRTHWVVGNWRWIKTNCCGRGAKITTPDALRSMSLAINIGGTYDKTDGGSKTNGNYTLGNFSEEDNRTTITFDDERPALLQGGGDTLILNYQYMDLQIEWYVREKINPY